MVKDEGASITITGSAPQTKHLYAQASHRRTYAQRVRSHERGFALREGFDPMVPLGYAPDMEPDLQQWWADPAGY